MSAPVSLRTVLRDRDFITAVTAYDPLTARLVEEAGFPVCYVGGYVVGAHLACSEPLMTATEMVDVSRRIVDNVGIPVIADAGAGFGNLSHTMRTIWEFERAGLAGIHIEDQVVPKRAGYHRGEVHVVSRASIRQKIEMVCTDRTSSDFVIIARTDARGAVDGGFDEAMYRLQMFLDCGADLVMAFPKSVEEAKRMAEVAPNKLVYVAPEGRQSRPDIPPDQLRDIGCKMVVFSEGTLLTGIRAQSEYLASLLGSAIPRLGDEALRTERARVERLISVSRWMELEDAEVA